MRIKIHIAILATVGWFGCTGESAQSVGDGGPDAAEGDGGSTEADSATTGSKSIDKYCSLAAKYLASCSGTIEDCEHESLEKCASTFSILREEVLAARVSCGFPETCDTAEPFDIRLCRHQATADVEPTSAQKELADAICDACGPVGETPCLENFFFRAAPRNDGSAMVSGIGASYFAFNDTVVARFASECVPPAGSSRCLPQFYDCVRDTVEQLRPESVVDKCQVPPMN